MIMRYLFSPSEGLEEAENIIKDIVSRDEFSGEPKRKVPWIKKALDWIFERINDLLEKLSELLEKIFGKTMDAGGMSTESKKILYFIIVAVLICVLVAAVILVCVLLSKRKKQKSVSKDIANELQDYLDSPETPGALAEKYLAEGNMKNAVRYLFISLLIDFNAKEIIRIHKSKTNSAYRSEIRSFSRELYENASVYFDTFDLCWYGERIPPEEKVRTLFEKYSALKKEADKGGTGA